MHPEVSPSGAAPALTGRRLGIGLAFAGMLLISLDSLFTRAASVDGWTVAFWFGTVMCPTMIVYLAIGSRTGPLARLREDGWPAVASAACQAISALCFVLAVKNTAIANVVVIIAAAPVFAAVISRLALGERTSTRVWIAIGGAMVGIVIVMSGSFGGGSMKGDLLALTAIVAFAVNLTIWRRYPSVSRSLGMAMAGLLMAVAALGPADIFGHDLETFTYLFLMGGVTGPAGRVALASSTRYLPAAEVGLFAPVETVAATTWAWLAFGESPSLNTAAGGVVVLGALVYGTRR
jgi:drug/metabolite transporter (DMT)-like permease